MFLKGIASGNLVDAHITVKRYLFPLLVLGRGPTQFIITLLKGSSITGMGTNGATCGGLVWLSRYLTNMASFTKLYYISS